MWDGMGEGVGWMGEGVGCVRGGGCLPLGLQDHPTFTTGVAPSTLFLGRDLRTQLDILRPDVGKHVRMQQSRQKALHDQHARDREFSVGQSVRTRNMREGPCWVPGTVVEILGPVSCLIRVQSGELWHR